jgi:Predicted periplasmic ligand-binding sensor domain
MTPPLKSRRPSSRAGADARMMLALLLVIVFFICSGLVAGANIRTIRNDNALVIRSQETVAGLAEVLSSIQDAETGQRGYLLTGNDGYLDPYRNALAMIPSRLEAIRGALHDDAGQQARLRELGARINDKLAELRETIDLRRDRGLEAALPVVNSDRGKASMDDIRARLAAMHAVEAELRAKRLAEMESAYATAITQAVWPARSSAWG